MFRPIACYIGLRYTRAKRRNHFISFISLASMLGIALGVTVLITVLSVMNGFDREIKQRIFGMVPAMTLTSKDNYLADWQGAQKLMQTFPQVKATAPFVMGQVLVSFDGSTQPALLSGILPLEEKRISDVSDKMVVGTLADLQMPGQFRMVIGEGLAARLNANVGDKITVMTPQVSLTPVGVMPRFKQFTVVGIFRAGSGFGFDMGMGFTNLQDAQRLMGLGNTVSGLHMTTDNIFGAPQIAQYLQKQLSSDARITTWADQFGEFFHAVQLEKTMMFIILLLIIAVAAFNLVSTLMMVVSEKEADIAILRTFGATARTIMAIFIVQGAVIGLVGTLLGLIGGLLLAYNVTTIVNGLQNLLHVQLLSSSVYFVDYLPSEVLLSDVLVICGSALFLSLLATLYPAYRAAKLDPVESLRYE